MSDGRNTKIIGSMAIVAIGLVIFAISRGVSGCGSAGGQSGSPSVVSDAKGDYVIRFKPDFKKGLAVQDDLGLSVVIAIDCSGSMKDAPRRGDQSKPKYEQASESLNNIVGFFQLFHRDNPAVRFKIALLKFNDEVKVLFPLAEMNERTLGELQAVTANRDNFFPGGSTAIGETLAEGTEILMQSGTIFRSLIIITDGENTMGVEPQPVLSALVENRNNVTTPDFPIFTSSLLVSFVGFDIEESVFGDLGRIGSRITSAQDKAALAGALQKIFLADITKLEAK